MKELTIRIAFKYRTRLGFRDLKQLSRTATPRKTVVKRSMYSTFLARILRMAECLYTTTNSLRTQTKFSFSDHANFGNFTLTFCRVRLLNLQSSTNHVLSYRPTHQTFCFSSSSFPSPSQFP